MPNHIPPFGSERAEACGVHWGLTLETEHGRQVPNLQVSKSPLS